ncbi:MAG: SufD family Fe-S cluster assembly protein [Anaeroplasmataceae bacterium]|nr:SufD family Fe-S cluster assembly protein [Anaeroplasmataceae bacterium]
MIHLNSFVGTEGNGLSLQNHVLTIHHSILDTILIQNDLKIYVCSGASVELLDMCQNQRIELYVEQGARVTYQILNSKNTYRNFKCNGELIVTQICLEESKESLDIELLSDFAKANVELLSLASHHLAEFTQRIEHKSKQTESNISNFGVALHSGEITFETTGQILKGMAKSKCVQLSKGIVLDDDSSVTSKPILLIDEFDVTANHGASIGKMSDDSLFYLMSRGLSKQEAFLLILEGILSPFISKVQDEQLKASIKQRIEQLLKR